MSNKRPYYRIRNFEGKFSYKCKKNTDREALFSFAKEANHPHFPAKSFLSCLKRLKELFYKRFPASTLVNLHERFTRFHIEQKRSLGTVVNSEWLFLIAGWYSLHRDVGGEHPWWTIFMLLCLAENIRNKKIEKFQRQPSS